ncbi:hypothetical protein [Streptomyces fuscichromogenes]|uniref:Uncharacterized protein n=1 Tax=Streptomyces fuscichromogenes TaxID=1324013 RepID=A0A917XPL7_9ACTN|nr:hypothetical protein [Streptomyces fuscichromogenes]GGN47296.1 hypothetical protein GCM10011578_100850 [Streptomyces fuscichromogenes]
MRAPRYIDEGHCSQCGGAAEQGRSGAWWHTGTPCGSQPAHFTPGPAPDAGAAARQHHVPRDRQIRHPGRDR